MEKKLKQVMELLGKNEELTKELFTQETPEGAQKVLKNAGFDFTIDEIKHVGKLISQAQENKGRELSEEDLANVAGGATVGESIDKFIGKASDYLEGWGNSFKSAFKGW